MAEELEQFQEENIEPTQVQDIQGEQVEQLDQVKEPVQQPPSKVSKLYNNLLKDGYTKENLGSESDFIKMATTKEGAAKLHSNLLKDGYTESNLGDLNSFTANLVPQPPVQKYPTLESFGIDNKNFYKPSPSDATYVAKRMTGEKIEQVEKYKKNLSEAIDNTTKRALTKKGIKAEPNTPIYNAQKKKVEDAIKNGDAVYSVDPVTKTPALSQTTDFLDSFWNALKSATTDEDEAENFVMNMGTQERLKYVQDRLKKIQPTEEGYIGEVATGIRGKAGELLGGVTPFATKATAGAMAGAGLIALAPETGGASLAAIPSVLSFAATAPSAIYQGGRDEVVRRFDIIKKKNPGLPDIEVMKEAEKGLINGEITGGVVNMLFMGAGKAVAPELKEAALNLVGKKVVPKPIAPEVKQTIGKFLENTLSSATHLATTVTTTKAGQEFVAGLEDKRLKETPKEILTKAVDNFTENFNVGAALHILMNPRKIPGMLKSGIKYALAKENPAEIFGILRNNEVLGNIPPGTAEKVMSDIEGYSEALNRTSENLTPETQASVAGLIQKRDNLVSEMGTKDPTQVESYQEQIDALNEQIKKITNTNDPFSYETNELGQTLNGEIAEAPLQKGVEEVPVPKEEIKTTQYDTENIPGIPSEIGVGEKPIQTQPIEGRGTQEIGGGGVLQEDVTSREGKVGKEAQGEIDAELKALEAQPEGTEAKKAEIERIKNRILPNQQKRLEDAKEIAANGTDFDEAVNNLQKKSEDARNRANERLKKEAAKEGVKPIDIQERLDNYEETKEAERYDYLIKQINDYYTEGKSENFGTSSQFAIAVENNELEKVNKRLEKSNAELKALEEKQKESEQVQPTGEEVSGAIQPTPEVPQGQKVEAGVQPSAEPISGRGAEATTPVLEKVKQNKDNQSEFTTSSGRQKVNRVGDELVVTDAKTGEKVSRKTYKKAEREYIDNFDFTHGEEGESTTQTQDVNKILTEVVETSNNPQQIAQIYAENDVPFTEIAMTKDGMIAEYGLPPIKKESYARFGDRNKITRGMVSNFFAKKGENAFSLDSIAKDISEHYFPEGDGTEISPEDIVDFMESYDSRKKLQEKFEPRNPLLDLAKEKFKKLTGIELTREVADKAFTQKIEKETQAEQNLLKQDYENAKQLEDEYWKQYEATDGFTKEAGVAEIDKGKEGVTEEGAKVEVPLAENPFEKVPKTQVARDKYFQSTFGENATKAEEIYNKYKDTNDFEAMQKEMQGEKVAEQPPVPPIVEKGKIEGSPEELKGITMEDNAKRREEIGMPERQANPESVEQWRAEAEKKIANGYDINTLIEKMERGDQTDKVENEISRIFAATLDEAVKRDPSNENINAYERLIKAREKSSTEIGRALRSLQGLSNPLENISDFFVAKKEANKVDNLTDAQKQEVIKDFESIQKAKEEYEKNLKEAETKFAELQAQYELLKLQKEAKKGKIYTKEGKRDFNAERQSLKDELKNAIEKYKNNANKLGISSDGGAENFAITVEMAKIIGKIAKSHVEEVGAKLADVTKRTFDDVKDLFDGITEKDIHDVIAGKYSERKERKSELLSNLRQVQAEAKLLNELDRVLAGEPKNEKQRIEKNQKLAELRKQINEIKKKGGLDEYSDEAKAKKAIEANRKKEEQLKERIKNEDFEPEEKKQSIYDSKEFKQKNPELYKKLLDSQIKVQEAELEFHKKLVENEMANMGKVDKFKNILTKARGTLKSVFASIDDSFVGIQGWAAIVTNPVIGMKAIKNHILDFWSQKRFDRYIAELHNSEDWNMMKESGLKISEPKSLLEEGKDEMFPTRFKAIIKINGNEYGWINIGGKKYELFDVLKPFERAFTSLGNSLRVIKFRTEAEKMYSKGITFENNPEEFKKMATRINTNTSAADPNKAFKSDLLNLAIWSPRLLASKLNLLGISDLASYTPLVKQGYYRSLGEKGKVLSKQQLYAIGDLAKFATSVVAGSYLYAAARGGKVNTNPYDDDFLDVKLPNGKSYNFTGGYSKYIGKIFQITSGGKVSKQTGQYEKYGAFKDRGSEVLHFMRGKMPPITGSVVNLAIGRDYTGKETSLSAEAEKYEMPMAIKQISGQIEKDGYSSLFMDGIPTFLGISVKDERDYSKPNPLFDKSEVELPEFKTLIEKGIEIPSLGNKSKYKVDKDAKHPDEEMSDEEFDAFKMLVNKYMKEGYADEEGKETPSIKDALNMEFKITKYNKQGEEEGEEYVIGKNLPKEKLKEQIDELKSNAVKKAKKEMGLISAKERIKVTKEE